MAYANVTKVLVAYLSTLPGVGGVSVEMPTTATYPFVVITRLPVGTSNGITDSPTVEVEVFHPDYGQAHDFALSVVAPAMAHLRHTVVGGVPIDDVRPEHGFGWVNYDPDLQRFVARYVVESRINAQP